NDAGQVTGVLAIPIIIPDPGNPEPGVLLHAYLWTPATPNGLTGTFQDLGAIGSASVGAALNASGEVVGNDGGFQTHAFLFRNGAVLDLNSLIPGNSGVTLSTANGINDAGQIAACGMIGLNFHAFLLTPTTGPVLPSAPTLLLATAGNASVTLTWQASVMATTYNVKRATSNAGPFTTIATVNAPTTQFVDKTAQNGVGYYYTVSSVNSVGESPNSLLAFAFPLPGPTNLTATAGTRQIVLNWKQPAGLAVNANIICRSCNGGQFMPIAAIKPTTTFTDKTVVPGLTYSYQVVATAAKFGSRQTPPSNTATATAH
ncbi:MAG: Chitinase, partial [Chthonomonadaceae bacterium]|nr:Chitinase [Chthonomonadaceae bacterium]